jgi:hypothetical protein
VAHVTASGTATTYPFDASGTNDGRQITMDQNGNVYTLEYSHGVLYKLSSTGSVTAADTSGHIGGAVSSLDTAHVIAEIQDDHGSLHASFSSDLGYDATLCGGGCNAGGISKPTSLAATRAGYVWSANNNNTLSEINPANTEQGTAVAGSPFSGGGLNAGTATQQPVVWLALDGAGAPWVPNFAGNSISHFSSAGVAISPSTGFVPSTGTCPAQGLAVDGSGDVWVSCASNTAPVVEFIGAATPVYTPLTPGFLGTKP